MAEEKKGHIKVTLDVEINNRFDGYTKRKHGKHAAHDSDDGKPDEKERVRPASKSYIK